MSRISHAARIERLRRQLQGAPDFKVFLAADLMALCLGRPPTPEESRLTIQEFMAKAPPRRREPSR